MNCNKAYASVQDLLDGTLDPREREALELHLGQCAQCAAHAEQYRALSSMLDENMAHEPAPAGLTDGVIATLRASGRIREVHARRAGVVGWLPGWLRVPAVAVVLSLLAIAILPASLGVLEGMVGKGTVLVADTYLEIQEKATDVGLFTKFVINLQKNLHMLRTILLASMSLIARAGEMFMLPALALVLALAAGVVLFVRSQRRSAHHASFSF